MNADENEWLALGDVLVAKNPLYVMQELKTVVRAEMFNNDLVRNIFKKWEQATTPEQINLLVAYDKTVIPPAAAEQVIEMLTNSTPIAPIPIKSIGQKIQDSAIKNLMYNKVVAGDIQTFADLATFTDEIEQLQNFEVDNTDLITEYQEYIGREREYIDLLTGFQIQAEKGQMIVIAGRPGMGKTALATNMMSYLTMYRVPVSMISLEMRRTEVFKRMVDRLMVEPNMTQEAALDVYRGNLDVFDIKDDVRSDITAIEIEIGRQAEQGRTVVIVDYLQLITSKGVSRYEQISDISRRLKLAAMKYNVLLIALAQLNRSKAGEKNKRPQITDLRDSGSIEQDADKVILLHADDYYEENTPTIVDLDLIVAKNRQGGQHTFSTEYDREKQSIVVIS